jgi:hypothetical protein
MIVLGLQTPLDEHIGEETSIVQIPIVPSQWRSPHPLREECWSRRAVPTESHLAQNSVLIPFGFASVPHGRQNAPRHDRQRPPSVSSKTHVCIGRKISKVRTNPMPHRRPSTDLADQRKCSVEEDIGRSIEPIEIFPELRH